MSLRYTLDAMTRGVNGFLAALIVAHDGIPIDEVTSRQGGFDVQVLTVEYAAVLKEIKRAVTVISMGDLEEVSITTSSSCVVVRVVNNDVFTVLIMKNDGDIGKGRYRLRLASLEIMKELA
ncbi:MAG: roadblock/LC7 domain-containing protein [Desulfuromonadaceae bacterium]|nr:roadblock/LC7 domain-containing protein [Desulfuromonadaceae bacterium]MDD5107094.1 roadblock/LC7 domain-containing protein [Desulfuromonadaceae bacterium]